MPATKLVTFLGCAVSLMLITACGTPSRTALATTPGFPVLSFPNTPDRVFSTVIMSNSMEHAAGITGRAFAIDSYERNSPIKTLLSIDINGNVGIAGTLSSASTRNQKYDISSFHHDGLHILRSTNIVSYHYKGEASDAQKHIGFIAEDTPAILSGPHHNQMNLNSSIGVTMDAAKQLDQEVQDLKLQVTALKREIGILRSDRLSRKALQ